MIQFIRCGSQPRNRPLCQGLDKVGTEGLLDESCAIYLYKYTCRKALRIIFLFLIFYCLFKIRTRKTLEQMINHLEQAVNNMSVHSSYFCMEKANRHNPTYYKNRFMKIKSILIVSLGLLLLLISCGKRNDHLWLTESIETATFQLRSMADCIEAIQVDTALLPRSVENDSIHYVGIRDWTCGFFPGSLWYGYELTADEQLKHRARRFTDRLCGVQYLTHTHDLGFMAFCSYGNAERLAPEPEDREILLRTARNLADRFDPKVGLIRSWDFGSWSYPVIIDNMMNLEILFWASRITGNDTYKDIAIMHADKTMANHYRDDMGCYHVVSYNPQDGSVESKCTHQGFSDSSVWARGQAWGLYGYTMCYRETGLKRYLDRAEAIARFLFTHPNMPQDLIPYWDLTADNVETEERDASAATVICSALFELSSLSGDRSYFDKAERILKTLSSDRYLAEKGTNHGFILKHSVGNHPEGTEIDVPINYADYYYLEALSRYVKAIRFDSIRFGADDRQTQTTSRP